MSKVDLGGALSRATKDPAIIPLPRTSPSSSSLPDRRQLRRGLPFEQPLQPEPMRGRAAPAAARAAGPSRAAVARAASGLPASGGRGGAAHDEEEDEGAQLLPRMKRPEELRELLRICRSVFRDDPGQQSAPPHDEEVLACSPIPLPLPVAFHLFVTFAGARCSYCARARTMRALPPSSAQSQVGIQPVCSAGA
jgi:hypothetical protein